MASPENYNANIGERTGYIARNVGVVFSVIGLFAPALLMPSLGLAASGEVLRRVSKDKNG